MSMRIEWASAPYVGVELLTEGAELPGYDDPVTAPYGVLLDGGSGGGYLVEGDAAQLRRFVDRLSKVVEQAELEQASRDARARNQAKFTPHKYRR